MKYQPILATRVLANLIEDLLAPLVKLIGQSIADMVVMAVTDQDI